VARKAILLISALFLAILCQAKPVILHSSRVSILSATIPSAGTTIVCNFSKSVSGTAGTGWAVSASGGAVTVSSGAGSGSATLTLTLSRTIAQGEVVTLTYAPGDIVTTQGNQPLLAFTGREVTNLATGGDAPNLTTATINAAGTTLTAVLSNAQTITNATGWSLEFDNYAERLLTYTGGSGTTTFTFTIGENPTYSDAETDNAAAPIGAAFTVAYDADTGNVSNLTDAEIAGTNNSTVIPDPDLPSEVDTALPANWNAAADHTPANNAAFQELIDGDGSGDAAAGDVIELTAGVDYGFITWNANVVGSAGNWIIVRSSEYDHASFPAYGERVSAAISAAVNTYMPTISRTITAGSHVLFTCPSGMQYVRFIGINFESRGTWTTTNYSTTIEMFNACNHLGWDRCRFWWQTELKPVQGWAVQNTNATDLFCIGSRFENYESTTADSSPTWLYRGSRLLVENNYFQCIDNGCFVSDNNPASLVYDVTIRRNYCTRPTDWSAGHGTQKAGGVELKGGLRVLIEENRIENIFSDVWEGIICKAGENSFRTTNHVTIRRNKITSQGTGMGITCHVAGSSGVSGPNTDYLVYENLTYSLGTYPLRFIGDTGYERVQALHNTLLTNNVLTYRQVTFIGGTDEGYYHIFKDNICGGYGGTIDGSYVGNGSVAINPAWTNGAYTITHNIFHGESINFYDNDTTPTPEGTLTNNAFPAYASIGFVDEPADNYRLTPGSTYSSTGASPASDGEDRGCDVDALETIMDEVEE
jgi:hypothetical protein